MRMDVGDYSNSPASPAGTDFRSVRNVTRQLA
jgi:hypothetical protein